MNAAHKPDRSAATWLSAIMLGVLLWALVLAGGVWLRWHDRYRGWRAGIVVLAAILFLAAWNLLVARRRSG